MKWEEIEVLEKVKNGEDKLLNPIFTLNIKGKTKGRLSNWTLEETNTYGYDYTKKTIKALIIPSISINLDNLIRFDNKKHEILYIINSSPRFNILHLKRLKDDTY